MSEPTRTGAPTTLARQATMRDLFAVIFRRRGIIMGLFVVVTLTVIVLAVITPLSFTSSGRVLVLRGERQSALSPNRQIMNEWEADLASEVETARSSTVIERTRKELARRALAAGRKPLPFSALSVGVEVMGKSNVLAIGYTDSDPGVAREVCDALLTAYLDYRQNGQRVPGQETFFRRQVDSLNAVIEQRMRERDRIAANTGVSNPLDQARDLTYQLGILNQRRNEAEADLAEARSSWEAMVELQKQPDIDLPTIGNAFTNDNALLQLKTKITDQQAAIARLRERFQDESPEVQNAMQTLETLQSLLRREMGARIAVSKSRFESLQARLDVHERDIADLRRKLDAMPTNQHNIEDIDNQVRQLRLRVDEYSKARDQMQITAHTSQELSVVLLSPAGPGLAKNARDYVRLALAPAFSLLVGVGIAFFIDGLDLTVRTASQAEEYLEMPVLASLSERRSKRR